MDGMRWVMSLVVWCAAGCGDKLYSDNVGRADAVGVDAGSSESPVTYEGQIKPVLDAHCINCHASALSGGDRNGASASVNYDTYASSLANADSANEQIQQGYMPPNTPLQDAEMALFQQWLDDGLQESACDCPLTEEQPSTAALAGE